MRKQLRRYLFLMTAGVVLFLPGCEQKTIHNILLDPHRYASQEVLVVGKVVTSYSVLEHGAYEVDDGTGTLWVISKSGVPREGARVAAKGTIRNVWPGGIGIHPEITWVRPFRRGYDGI